MVTWRNIVLCSGILRFLPDMDFVAIGGICVSQTHPVILQTAELMFFVIDNQTRAIVSMLETAYLVGKVYCMIAFIVASICPSVRLSCFAFAGATCDG